jgi:sporulation protein YlmC with PRC-barrel domain
MGCVVRTEAGEELGRVHDLRAHTVNGGWRLTELVVGPAGLRSRFGTGKPGSRRRGSLVPWQAVLRLDDGVITVRGSGSEIASRSPG